MPDSFLTYNLSTDTLTLFIPPLDPEEVPWNGLPMTIEEAKAIYNVNKVKYTCEPVLSEEEIALGGVVYVYSGTAQVNRPLGVPSTAVNNTLLKLAIDEARVKKDAYELALIKHANKISAAAHNAVLRCARRMQNECEAMALFEAVCLANGATGQAYPGIYASGRSASTLHYVRNNASLVKATNPQGTVEKPQILLVDAGCEFRCYASDITRVVPLAGSEEGSTPQFSKEAREIYSLVLRMQKECMDLIRPGVHWDDIHTHAHRVLIEGFLYLGIFRNTSTVDEILHNRTSCAFLPHGLGHWIGMDTHDTGGKANYSDPDPMFRWLRVRRELVTDAVITVEPGVYFCPFIIDSYLAQEKHKRYIDEEVLDRYWPVGGIRIEDDIVVCEEGGRSLSLDAVKELDQVEKLAIS